MDLVTSYDNQSDVDEDLQNSENCITSCRQPEGGESDANPETESESQSTKCDYFGLTDTDSDSNEDISPVIRQTTENRESCKKHKLSVDSTSPEAKFWRGDDEKVNWDDVYSVWRCNSSNQNTREVSVSDSKPSTHLTTNHSHTNVNSRLSKSCFAVHQKVAPYLHSSLITNKPPKNQLRELDGHLGAINRVVWCVPNFSHLLLTACMDKTVKIWNALSSSKTCVQTLRHHDKAVKDAKWSSCGLHVLSCSYDKTSCIMDVEKGCCISKFVDDNFVTCVTYHPINHHVFISGTCNSLKAWDCRASTKPIKTFSYKDKFGQVQDVVFMNNGSQFFSCNDLVSRDSADRNIMAWDFTNEVVLSNQIYQERFTCCRLCVHPDQSCFMAQSQANYIALFSTSQPYKLNKCKRFDGHKVLSYAVGFDISNDGKLVISGSTDGVIPIYDYKSTRVVKRLSIGQHQVALDVAWHPVLFSTIAVVTWDGNIYIWQ